MCSLCVCGADLRPHMFAPRVFSVYILHRIFTCVHFHVCVCVLARYMVPSERVYGQSKNFVIVYMRLRFCVYAYVYLCICVIAHGAAAEELGSELHGVNTRSETFCGSAQKLLCAPRSFSLATFSFSCHFFTQKFLAKIPACAIVLLQCVSEI